MPQNIAENTMYIETSFSALNIEKSSILNGIFVTSTILDTQSDSELQVSDVFHKHKRELAGG